MPSPGRKTVVALLFGGRSAEHDVSISSARAVHKNLDPARFDVVSLFLNKDGLWRRVDSPHLPPEDLNRGPFEPFLPWAAGSGPTVEADVYWPVLHGPFGEDGTVQGLLELADSAYVGSGVLGSAAGMDKAVMKELFRSRGLPTVPHLVVTETEWSRSPAAVRRRAGRELHTPLFVKPANLGSSVGITKVKAWSDLPAALAAAFRYDPKALVEQGVDCRELECAVLGNEEPRASLPGEVLPAREFYDYEDKYLDGKTGFAVPARLPAGLTARVRRLAVGAFQACACSGLARVDFFLERGTRQLFVNEINTMPGFTEISMYPKLWAATGLPFPALAGRLVELGLERHRAKKRCVVRTAR